MPSIYVQPLDDPHFTNYFNNFGDPFVLNVGDIEVVVRVEAVYGHPLRVKVVIPKLQLERMIDLGLDDAVNNGELQPCEPKSEDFNVPLRRKIAGVLPIKVGTAKVTLHSSNGVITIEGVQLIK